VFPNAYIGQGAVLYHEYDDNGSAADSDTITSNDRAAILSRHTIPKQTTLNDLLGHRPPNGAIGCGNT